MGDNPYQDDRGNKDRSITKAHGVGETPLRKGGKAVKVEGETPFLIGDTMTGGYGKGPDILHDCTIAVNAGEIAVIVGPNGAGKSTAMKAVFGMLDVRKGRVLLDGEDITALSPQDRVQKGMGFVPQTNNIFTSMTVEENLEMGAFIRRDDIRDTMEQVYELFPILRDKRRQDAGRTHRRRQPHRHGRAVRPHHRGQPHRPADSDGGTERAPGPGHRRQGLRAGAGRQRLYRHGQGIAGRSRSAQKLSGGLTWDSMH